jgi:hypothetical protein
MTVKELIKQLQSLKPSLQDCEVKVIAPNKEFFSPDIKFVTKERFNLDLTPENIDFIWLKY